MQYKWEQPKTIGLALLAAGTLIKSPPISWLLDNYVLHGLYLLIGHTFILSGIASIAYSANHKLRSEHEIRLWHLRFIVVPWNLTVATMIGLFVGGAHYGLDQLFQFPASYNQAVAYWIAYDVGVTYFLLLCAYALVILVLDPPSRAGASIYLAAVGFGLITVTCRVLLITVDDHVRNSSLIDIANTANALALSLFAIGAAYMWRVRVRSINECGNIQKQNVIRNT